MNPHVPMVERALASAVDSALVPMVERAVASAVDSALVPMVERISVALLAGLAVLVWPRLPASPSFVAAHRGALTRGRRLSQRLMPGRWRSGQSSPAELAVPEVLDLVALTLEAGASTAGGLRTTADRLPGQSGQELRTVAAALEWGLSERAAWAAAPARWEPAARALRVATRAGVPPAGLLRRAAEDIRRERLHRIEAATARLAVRLVLPLGLAFLPAFVLTTVVPVVLALTQQWLGAGLVGF